MTASIHLRETPELLYLLQLADTCLISGQRLAEWCGHGPMLEEDIALANMALDLIGQARALLDHAAALEGAGHDEDQLAFLREERDFRHPTLVELPRGDFAFTMLRSAFVSAFLVLLWRGLESSSDATLAGIAAKASKEARYHHRHAADWVVRLGDGSEESARRLGAALERLWPYTAELFVDDEAGDAAAASGLGPRWSALEPEWRAAQERLLAEARLDVPAPSRFLSHGRRGRHSEHLGPLLATMQHLQRAYLGGAW